MRNRLRNYLLQQSSHALRFYTFDRRFQCKLSQIKASLFKKAKNKISFLFTIHALRKVVRFNQKRSKIREGKTKRSESALAACIAGKIDKPLSRRFRRQTRL